MVPRAPAGAEPVPARRVIDHWLELEFAKPTVADLDRPLERLSDSAANDALLEVKPGAASVFHEEPTADWYRLRLTRAELGRLRFIDGPADALWGALASDRSVLEGARSIRDGSTETLDAETGVDVDHIQRVATRVAAGESIDPPVLFTRRGRTPVRILDGNHRVTGYALAMLAGEPVDQLPAFLGVASNPIVRPALERIGGFVDRLQGRRRF